MPQCKQTKAQVHTHTSNVTDVITVLCVCVYWTTGGLQLLSLFYQNIPFFLNPGVCECTTVLLMYLKTNEMFCHKLPVAITVEMLREFYTKIKPPQTCCE